MVIEKTILSGEEAAEIIAAIRLSEKRTSAEIFAVLARQSDDYRLAALAFLLLYLLAISLGLAAIAWWRWVSIPLPVFVAAQCLAAATMGMMVSFLPGFAVRLVPRRVRYRRAHASAAQQFLAHGIQRTSGRTGVLVFVSLAERYAEIIADSSIATKFGQEFWNDAVARLTQRVSQGEIKDAYVEVIAIIGDRLAKDFPRGSTDRNELEDRLVIL
jgi:putative membrane protein